MHLHGAPPLAPFPPYSHRPCLRPHRHQTPPLLYRHLPLRRPLLRSPTILPFSKPNTFMYNILIWAFSKSSTPDLAMELFVEMLCGGTMPDWLTYPSVFSGYSRLGWVRSGRELHGMVVKHGLAGDIYVHNAMMAMYATGGYVMEVSVLFDECVDYDVVSYNSMITGLARRGQVDEARALFDEMPERTVATWRTMISGYVRNARDQEALDLFSVMQSEGMEPNINILVCLLGACANLGAIDQGI